MAPPFYMAYTTHYRQHTGDSTMTQTSESQKQEQPENIDDVLFDARKIGPYVVRPLTFGKLAEVAPLITPIVPAIMETLPEDISQLQSSDILRAIILNLNLVTPVMAVCVGATVEEIEELDASTGAQLAAALVSANLKVLTSFFTLSGNPQGNPRR